MFYDAVDAIINGDLETLGSLLEKDPQLIKARSTKEHQATLLHYVSANGVEDHLQKCPPNAGMVTKHLIDAGADVDAVCNVYGGGDTQTPLNLTASSYHPAAAGVQKDIIQELLKGGAAIEGLGGNGSPLKTAIAFGYGDAVSALVDHGATIDCIQVASAAAGVAEISRYFDGSGELKVGAGRHDGPAIRSLEDSQAALDEAFWYACLHNKLENADFLLGKGADIAAKVQEGFTALHSATTRGSHETIAFLLDRDAPLEIVNDYGGTVLDTLCWAAVNMPKPHVDYPALVQTLLKAGAKKDAVSPFPSGNTEIDALLRQYSV